VIPIRGGRASSWTERGPKRECDSSRTSLVVRGRGKFEKEEKKEIAKVGHFCDHSNRIDRLLQERLPAKYQRISEQCPCMIEKDREGNETIKEKGTTQQDFGNQRFSLMAIDPFPICIVPSQIQVALKAEVSDESTAAGGKRGEVSSFSSG